MNVYDTLNRYFKKTKKYMSDDNIKNIYEGIQRICQRNNIDINNLDYLAEGESSLVFEYMDKIIKFIPVNRGINLTNYLKDSRLILRPDDEEIVHIKYPMGFEFDMSIIITEKLNINNDITVKQALSFANELLKDGYVWLDIKPRNLASDINGNIKLIDYGELFNQKYDTEFYNHLQAFHTIYNSILQHNRKRNFFKR